MGSFSGGSSWNQQSNRIWSIGAEASLGPVNPDNATLAGGPAAGVWWRGCDLTIAMMTTDTTAQVLANVSGYPIIVKNGVVNINVHYSIPMISSGEILVNSTGAGTVIIDWEVQGLLWLL